MKKLIATMLALVMLMGAMIENVITLFCEENLAEMAEEEPAA